MMEIWVAVMLTCTNLKLSPNINCDLGGSEEVYASKVQCEEQASKVYRRPINCIKTVLEMTGVDKSKTYQIK